MFPLSMDLQHHALLPLKKVDQLQINENRLEGLEVCMARASEQKFAKER